MHFSMKDSLMTPTEKAIQARAAELISILLRELAQENEISMLFDQSLATAAMRITAMNYVNFVRHNNGLGGYPNKSYNPVMTKIKDRLFTTLRDPPPDLMAEIEKLIAAECQAAEKEPVNDAENSPHPTPPAVGESELPANPPGDGQQ
jgi:hypothetical protein